MAKTLYVVRHGKARTNQAAERDLERPLEAVGLRQASRLGQYLYNKRASIDALISSNALRAIQTAEQIADQLNHDLNKILIDEDLYEASVRILTNKIHEFNTSWEEVIIVGHNPVVSYFVEFATGHHFDGMQAGSLVKISSTASSWAEMTKDKSCFEYYISPDDLPTAK